MIPRYFFGESVRDPIAGEFVRIVSVFFDFCCRKILGIAFMFMAGIDTASPAHSLNLFLSIFNLPKCRHYF